MLQPFLKPIEHVSRQISGSVYSISTRIVAISLKYSKPSTGFVFGISVFLIGSTAMREAFGALYSHSLNVSSNVAKSAACFAMREMAGGSSRGLRFSG